MNRDGTPWLLFDLTKILLPAGGQSQAFAPPAREVAFALSHRTLALVGPVVQRSTHRARRRRPPPPARGAAGVPVEGRALMNT